MSHLPVQKRMVLQILPMLWFGGLVRQKRRSTA